ncbi:hypothetical protein C8J57DRAFT_1237649 [Mycena rebaudengoi]|nr:hypothetical protein C8J57DRAFT_1237649 [Mycena rebaudengoi]
MGACACLVLVNQTGAQETQCKGHDDNLVLSEHRDLDKLMQEPKRDNVNLKNFKCMEVVLEVQDLLTRKCLPRRDHVGSLINYYIQTPNLQGAFKRMILGELQKYLSTQTSGSTEETITCPGHRLKGLSYYIILEGNWGLKVSSSLRLSFWSDFDSRPTIEIRPQTQLESAYSIHTGGVAGVFAYITHYEKPKLGSWTLQAFSTAVTKHISWDLIHKAEKLSLKGKGIRRGGRALRDGLDFT